MSNGKERKGWDLQLPRWKVCILPRCGSRTIFANQEKNASLVRSSIKMYQLWIVRVVGTYTVQTLFNETPGQKRDEHIIITSLPFFSSFSKISLLLFVFPMFSILANMIGYWNRKSIKIPRWDLSNQVDLMDDDLQSNNENVSVFQGRYTLNVRICITVVVVVVASFEKIIVSLLIDTFV